MKYFLFLSLFCLVGCTFLDKNSPQSLSTNVMSTGSLSGPQDVSSEMVVSESDSIAPIIPLGQDREYDGIYKKFVESEHQSYESGSYVRKTTDTKIFEEYKNVFIRLFQEKKLPILRTISLSGQTVYVSAAYSSPKNSVSGDGFSCGAYGRFDGSASHGLCLAYTQFGNTHSITSDIFIAQGWDSIQVFSGSYIVNISRGGDVCAGNQDYALFDNFLHLISRLNHGFYSCDLRKESFTKSGNTIQFIDFPEIGQDAYVETSTGTYIPRASHMQIYRFDDDTPSVVLKEIVGEREPFIFDPMKNLLNGDNFEFQFSGKKFIIAGKEIGAMTPLRNGDRSANYHLTLSGEAGIDREIYGRVSGASGSIWWGWPIEEVSFLSCINNSGSYDTEWYKLKSYNKSSGTFSYKLNKKLGNICDIPYKLRLKTTSGSTIESSIDILK